MLRINFRPSDKFDVSTDLQALKQQAVLPVTCLSLCVSEMNPQDLLQEELIETHSPLPCKAIKLRKAEVKNMQDLLFSTRHGRGLRDVLSTFSSHSSALMLYTKSQTYPVKEQLTAVQQYLTETLSDTDDSKVPATNFLASGDCQVKS